MGDSNRLYFGDNLDILRRHVDDESVDLVYLDPPFNSNQDYNVLFAGRTGTRAAAQIKAFEDRRGVIEGPARASTTHPRDRWTRPSSARPERGDSEPRTGDMLEL